MQNPHGTTDRFAARSAPLLAGVPVVVGNPTADDLAASGLKLSAAAAAVAAFAMLSSKAYAQTASDVLDVLQFAYVLENFEAEFYKSVLNAGTAVSAVQAGRFAPVRAAVMATPNGAAIIESLDQIRKHEEAHVITLRDAIQAKGGTAPVFTGDSFDFSGGRGTQTGPFVGVFTNPQVLLLASQAFEDLGVRAYKGQAGRLINDEPILETALRIHSVEARHAAKIRKVRRQFFSAPDSVRFSGTVRRREFGPPPGVTLPAEAVTALQNIYANPAPTSAGTAPEDNTIHTVNNGTADVMINVATLAGILGGPDALTEAFDEALSKEQVIPMVQPFVIPPLA